MNDTTSPEVLVFPKAFSNPKFNSRYHFAPFA